MIGGTKIDDPRFFSATLFEQGDQWALHRIGIKPETSFPGTVPPSSVPPGSGEAVVAAFVDSGLDYQHPDLAPDALWKNPKEVLNGQDDDGNGYVDDLIGWNFVDDDNNPWDDFGHGTMMAGLLGAEGGNGLGIAGMAPGVRIMPLKVFNFLGRARSHRVSEAIVYAVQNGASVICLGQVERLTRAETLAVTHAARAGVVVVAAGHGQLNEPGFDNLITVGASDAEDRPVAAGQGGPPDVLAPGVDILSLRARRTDFVRVVDKNSAGQNLVGPEDMFYRADRASLAAAFVTGVVGLLQARSPELSPRQVKQVLRNSARPVGASTELGILDATTALQAEPGFWLDARVEIRERPGQVLIEGVAASDRIRDSWLEIGKGKRPAEWKRLPLERKGTGRLVSKVARDDIPTSWTEATFRLVVVHESGVKRSVRDLWRANDLERED